MNGFARGENMASGKWHLFMDGEGGLDGEGGGGKGIQMELKTAHTR